MMKLNQVLTPLTTQSYLPIAPLLVKIGLQKDAQVLAALCTAVWTAVMHISVHSGCEQQV